MGAVVLLNKPAGARPVMDDRRRFDLFPNGVPVQGWWLYAIGLPDGRLKIGIAAHPRSRIAQHWRTHGGLPWAHVFGTRFAENHTARHAEMLCLQAAVRCGGTRIGRSEYLKDIAPQVLVLACRTGLADHAALHAARRRTNP